LVGKETEGVECYSPGKVVAAREYHKEKEALEATEEARLEAYRAKRAAGSKKRAKE
jgi:hypothetical protein